MARLRQSSLGRGRFGTTRRKTSWAVGPGGTSLLSIAAPQTSVVGSGATSLEDGLTVVRLRGELLLRLQTPTTDGFTGAFGIALCTAAAFAVGITALQKPISDEDWDGWLYHQYFAINGEAAGDLDTVVRTVVDSKAMRKLPQDMVVFSAIQTSIETGTATLQVFFNSRMLVKLP